MAEQAQRTPDQWTPEDASAKISGAVEADPLLASNRQFYEGDHWQDGTGFIGPKPSSDEKDAQQAMTVLKEAFVSRNVVKEGVQRRTGGVVGRPVDFSVVPIETPQPGEEQPEVGQADPVVTELTDAFSWWYGERHLHRLFQEFTSTMLFAKRAALRLLVPPALLERRAGGAGGQAQTGAQQATTVREALAKLFAEHPKPEDSVVWTDPSTMQSASVVRFKRGDQDAYEVAYLGPATGASGQGAQRQPPTMVRVLGGAAPAAPVPLNLAGRLPMHEERHPAFITPQVQQLQRACNLAFTVMPRTLVTAGWLQTLLTNAQMPGSYVDDPTAPMGKRFVPRPLEIGPGQIGFVAGIPEQKLDGSKSYSSPGVHWREPVDSKPSVEASNACRAVMLGEMDQEHVLMEGDGAPSGLSRIEARAGFVNSLRITQAPVEGGATWLFNTALAWVEHLMNAPGKYTSKYRFEARCNLTPGMVSAEERAQYAADAEKGLLPQDDAMMLSGVENVSEAMEKIRRQPMNVLALREKQATVMQLFTAAGTPLNVAAYLVGIRPEDLKDMEKYLSDLEALYGDGTEAQRTGQEGGELDDEGNPQPDITGGE